MIHTSSPARFLTVLLVLAIGLGLLSPLFTPPAFAQEPPAPEPVSPAYNATIAATNEYGAPTPPLAVPVFSWSAVNGAAKYRLQISADLGFSKIDYNVVTPLTGYIPPNPNTMKDGEWYWRVRVEAPVAGEYSQTMLFTKDWGSPENTPLLLAPEEGATLEFLDTLTPTGRTFSWTPVTGAAQYRFQISTSPDFSTTTLKVNILTITPSHQSALKLDNNATYYWRVIPVDANGQEGTISEARTFTMGYNQVPQPLEPVNNSTPVFTPTFRWTAMRGAQFYVLQYSTDPELNNAVTNITTRNTSYTPDKTLQNDQNYYWRVRAHSGSSVSAWSTIQFFKKKWYIRPQPLTPTNSFEQVRFPLFSWTPVPGAAYYEVTLIRTSPYKKYTGKTANPFWMPQQYEGVQGNWTWYVTPYDGSGNQGKQSVEFSYLSSAEANAPTLAYPLYYYPPNQYSVPEGEDPNLVNGIATNPSNDRTVPLPVFVWHRLTYIDGGMPLVGYYKLEVSKDSQFRPQVAPVWTVNTENTSAAPTSSNPFVPEPGTDYFWRVCGTATLGGACIVDPIQGKPLWSQVWRTRIDLAAGLNPNMDAAPVLMRPEHGSEVVEAMPVFEWWPVLGADAYLVQISDDPTFTTSVDSATVTYPTYAATEGLGQRATPGRLGFGTYYWRVQAIQNGSGTGTWSEVRRFQVAAQGQWQLERADGSDANRLQIAVDPAGEVNAAFDLTRLNAAQSKDYWYFGFNKTAGSATYVLYLDLDHKDNSGATIDAEGNQVTTIPGHRPEYAIYIPKENGAIFINNVQLYEWDHQFQQWKLPQNLGMNGGALWTSATGDYVELRVASTLIGGGQDTGSYAVSLFTIPLGGGNPQDSLPHAPGATLGTIDRFTSVSEKLNLVYPFNTTGTEPRTIPDLIPLMWNYPVGAPWAGAFLQVSLDERFTSPISTFEVRSDWPGYASLNDPLDKDIIGDNTYYWRVAPRYLTLPGKIVHVGAYSEPWRFNRLGFVPQNLRESVSFATPTFSWDIVEGAESYELQVDDDPGFKSLNVSVITRQTAHTPTDTLPNGVYYWRVRAKRWGNINNEWTPTRSFTLTLPTPANLAPDGNQVVKGMPTLCWDPIVAAPDDGLPVLAAHKYRVQVSKGDPNFSQIYDTIDTEQACWTPQKGYEDGQYFWRAAMIDGSGRLGAFSQPAVFTKQYPVTELVFPLQAVSSTPTFRWKAVQGAAAYKIEISTAPTFSPLLDSAETKNTTFTPVKEYGSGKVYYWRVAMIDKDKRQGPFSDAAIRIGPALPPGQLQVYVPIVFGKR